MKTPKSRGPSISVALTIAVVAAAVAIASTIVVIRNDFSTIVEALLAAVSLLAFGVTAYGHSGSTGDGRQRRRETPSRPRNH